MMEFIKRIPPRAEFCFVLLVGFGDFLLANAHAVLRPSVAQSTYTNAGILGLVQYELLVACILAPLLYLRGWRLSQIAAPFTRSDIVATIGLIVAIYAADLLILQVAEGIDPTMRAETERSFVLGNLLPGSAVMASVVNPFFEEMLLCGYIVTALKERRGLWFAVNASVALRLAIHLYQGTMGVLIVPFGLLLTYWYARTNRLWPVIVAHAVFDLVALWPYVGNG